MSSTNKTTNLELSQFIGSDKPQWLVDYNGDMSKIDAGIGNVKAQADATDLTVASHTSSIANLSQASTDQATAITGLRTDVDGNTGSINTINSLIGNGEPTTTDKTLIGAINELNAAIGTGEITVKTLAASGTAVEFDVPTSGNYVIGFYVSDGSNYTAIDTSVAGKVTLTFEAVASVRSVACEVKEVVA